MVRPNIPHYSYSTMETLGPFGMGYIWDGIHLGWETFGMGDTGSIWDGYAHYGDTGSIWIG
jgi:hypothetical protein